MPDLEKLAMDQFRLRWRFTDARYHLLPEHHLSQIAPLQPRSAGELMGMTNAWFKEHPFTSGLFPHLQSIALAQSSQADAKVVRKWLYGCGVPFQRKVYLSWNPTDAVETNWKMVVKYWDDFWYPSSDDLVVFDDSLRWALLFWHEEVAYFASHTPLHRPLAGSASSNAA